MSHVITDEGRVVAVVEAEAAEESGVGDEAAPAPADGRDAGEGGGMWGDEEEDLCEKIIDIERRRRGSFGVARSASSPRATGATPPLSPTLVLLLPPLRRRRRRAPPGKARVVPAAAGLLFPARLGGCAGGFLLAAVRFGRRRSSPAAWFPWAGGLRRGGAAVGRGSSWWRR
jgi:hypothetical protein